MDAARYVLSKPFKKQILTVALQNYAKSQLQKAL